MTRTFWNTPSCSRVCDWNTRCTTPLLTCSSSNTNESNTLGMLWFSRIARYEYEYRQRCPASSRTDFMQRRQFIYTTTQFSQHHASVSKRSTETRDSYKVWNVFMLEYWRIREGLRVFWTTHLKCSVVFDWNTIIVPLPPVKRIAQKKCIKLCLQTVR